jgi:hypothetical protein
MALCTLKYLKTVYLYTKKFKSVKTAHAKKVKTRGPIQSPYGFKGELKRGITV